MKKVGILCKPDTPEPPEIMAHLIPWLEERDVEVFLEKKATAFENIESYPRSELPNLVDLIIVLGGDGTMLSAARLVADRGIPILGVNLGGLGFLTEVYKKELFEALERIFRGEGHSEERLMLSARILRGGEKIAEYTALNDVVINKGSMARIIDLEVSVNKTYVTLFKSDGAIVATPTGSTAYSLSAGGPILYPTLHAIVLTPISPHTLTNRPLVLPDDVDIELALKSVSEGVLLSLDGQVGYTLSPGDIVHIKRAPFNAILLRPLSRDHFSVLRTKLKWGER